MAHASSVASIRNQTVLSRSYALSLNQEPIFVRREAMEMNGRTMPPSIMPLCFEILGPLDTVALQSALRAVVQRHPALRVQIAPNPAVSPAERASRIASAVRADIAATGIFIQRVVENWEQPLELHTALSASAEQVAKHLLRVELTIPFRDGSAQRLRSKLVRFSDTSHVLILTIDHRMSDGRSLGILQNEIQSLYGHFACGGPALPQQKVSYLEFAERQQEMRTSSSFDMDLDYWERHWRCFGGARLRVGDIPFAVPVPDLALVFDTERLSVSEADTRAFRSAAKRARVTPYVFFLSAFLAVLRLYVGRDRLALWTHCANRTPETVNSIGFYINTHLMGFEVSADCTARDLLTQASQRHLQTLKHQGMPITLLWETLRCSPLFRDAAIMLDYWIEKPVFPPAADGVTFRKLFLEMSPPGRIAQLAVVVVDHGETLSIHCDHVSQFSGSAIRLMVHDLLDAAKWMCNSLDEPLSSLASITDRYPPRPEWNAAKSEMEEFIVSGSANIPSRKQANASKEI